MRHAGPAELLAAAAIGLGGTRDARPAGLAFRNGH